jgi:threonine dehydrogenase-like Zn-dependent dehydrogenase
MDVVIETVGGKADTLSEAVSMVATSGTIAMLGVFDGAPRIPAFEFASRELNLVGSYCYAHDARVGDFAYATALLAKHRDALAPLVTHRFKLDQVTQAYAAAADKRSGSIKVQIEP